MTIKQATPTDIAAAVELLRAGEMVAFPTETVFGLGADARNKAAVEKIYAAKGRDALNSLPVMVHDIAQVKQIAEIDARALTLMQVMWPGPVSLVLALRDGHGISDKVLGGKTTILLRMPKHPVALALLKAFDAPLAATSANLSGKLSATTASDAAQELGDRVAMILADTGKVIGMESTIVDLSIETAKILRHGAVTKEEIEMLIGPVEEHVAAPQDKPIALQTPLRLNAVDVKKGEAFLGFGNLNYIGAEGVGFVRDMPAALWRNLSAQGDLDEAVANLYPMLQELDRSGASRIAVMRLPEMGLGKAINDRLQRAAAGKGKP